MTNMQFIENTNSYNNSAAGTGTDGSPTSSNSSLQNANANATGSSGNSDYATKFKHFLKSLFKKKSIPQILAQLNHTTNIEDGNNENENEGGQYKKHLNVFDLTCIGIGGIIGTGIFVLTGTAAATKAGPAVILSFLIAFVVSLLSALCYAELSSTLPLNGSAYTYTYVTMGELIAWIIGWDLILEYLVGASTVAVGWSGYFQSFMNQVGVRFGVLGKSPFEWDGQRFIISGSVMDLPAILITLLVTSALMFGVRTGIRFNSFIVTLKLIILILFICIGMAYIQPSNYQPFIPPNQNQFGHFGISGIFQASTVVFFAYIGFDAISTTAQECLNPQRDLPVGILSSLSICTLMYCLVCLVLCGVVKYTELNVSHPIDIAISRMGLGWLGLLCDLGAILGLSSVLLVLLLAQPRLFQNMSQDGLLPQIFMKIHPKYHTPFFPTLLSGLLCSVLAGLLPIDVLGELTSVGTLFAFSLVCLGVIYLRLKEPHLKRGFRVPGGLVVPVLGVVCCLGMVCVSQWQTLVRLVVWMMIGLGIYFSYGRKRSRVVEEGAYFEMTNHTADMTKE